MEFRCAYLLGADIWQTKESVSLTDRLLKSVDYNSVADRLFTYRPDGILFASHSITAIECQLPDFWKNKIITSYMVHEERIDEYLFLRSVVNIRPQAIPELISLDSVDYCKHMDTLFETIFPSLQGPRVQANRSWPRFLSILYLEPMGPFNFTDNNMLENAPQLAVKIQSVLRFQKETACLPHLFMDTLLLPSVGAGLPEEEAVAVCFRENINEHVKVSVNLPEVVLDILNYMVSIQITRHLSIRLKKLPLYASPLDQYIERLVNINASSHQSKRGFLLKKNGSPILRIKPYRNMNKKISEAYEYNFLKDRQEVMLEREKVSQSAAAVSHLLTRNYVSIGDKIKVAVLVDTRSSHPYKYGFLPSLRSKFQSEQTEMRRIDGLIATRESILADYLRDTTLATSTRSNLQLQYSIRRLTVVAILVAILSVFLTLPQEVKRWVYEVVTNIFR